jgi:hypothetical protein
VAKFATSVVDTGANLLPVSLIPAAILSSESLKAVPPVSLIVYLGAACLPLNVVENQTTVSRLCRPESVNATGHSWRTGVNIVTKQPRHSRAAVVATHNNFGRDTAFNFL